MRKSELVSLLERIRELEAESRAIGTRVRSLKGLDRHQARQDKRDLGSTTRLLLLTYGFLRGVPYERIERNVDKLNNPRPSIDAIVHCAHDWSGSTNDLREQVEAWLAGSLTSYPVVEKDSPKIEEQPAPAQVPQPAPKAGFLSKIGQAIRSAVGAS